MKKYALEIFLILVMVACAIPVQIRESNASKNLCAAIEADNQSKIDAILARTSGDKIDASARIYHHPLILACKKGQLETVKKLVKKGVDVNYAEDNDTPLMYALDSPSPDRYKIASYLIDKGADMNFIDDRGFSPFTEVLDKCSNDSDETREERFELFKYLYENANIKECMKASNYEDAFALAVNADSADALSWLIKEKHFSIDKFPEKDGSKLHYCYNLFEGGDISYLTNKTEMIGYLLDNGIEDINTRNSEGDTLIITAAKASDEKTAEMLISRGANKYLRNNDGRIAYNYAAEAEDQEMMAMLR